LHNSQPFVIEQSKASPCILVSVLPVTLQCVMYVLVFSDVVAVFLSHCTVERIAAAMVRSCE
jgi:hypothetical protein